MSNKIQLLIEGELSEDGSDFDITVRPVDGPVATSERGTVLAENMLLNKLFVGVGDDISGATATYTDGRVESFGDLR